MAKLSLSFLAILVIAVALATFFVVNGIDPESVEAWYYWSFAAIIAASIST